MAWALHGTTLFVCPNNIKYLFIFYFLAIYRSLSESHLQSVIYSANPKRRSLEDRVASESNLQ